MGEQKAFFECPVIKLSLYQVLKAVPGIMSRQDPPQTLFCHRFGAMDHRAHLLSLCLIDHLALLSAGEVSEYFVSNP